MWFVTCIAGFTTRTELLGVTSIIRAMGLDSRYYDNLLDCFHSKAIKLVRMNRLWVKLVFRIFPGILQVNGRIVLVGDGIKVPKRGKKMPGVKCLHQSSDSNTKPEYIMGHSFQAISVLAQACNTVLAVPLAARIHEGIVTSNRDKRTLLDRMILLLLDLDIELPYYFVADAYYASQKIVNGLSHDNNHLVTRAKSNAVAYEPFVPVGNTKTRGRPRKYGKKVVLQRLFSQSDKFESVDSPVYGESGVMIQFQTCDLLWRPAGRIVRFVLAIHPTRGRCILMSTDTSLSAVEVIRLYGLRFKIEHSFKQAVRVIGAFSYHFWMKTMKPLRRRNGNQYLHRETKEYREAVQRKLHAYHVFVLAGTISQGLMQYLAAVHPEQVWRCFGSWLRTIRPGVAPSELVVAMAMRQRLPEFLLASEKDHNLAKFIAERQDAVRWGLLRMAS